MKNRLLATVLAFTLLASCKKNDDKNKAQQLTSGKWHFKSYVDHQTLPATLKYDYTPYLKDCAKDESYEFQGDGDYIWDNGVKCDPNALQTISGTWKLFDGDSKMVMNVANTSYSDTVMIDKINGSTLVTAETYYIIKDGVTYKGIFKITYTH